MFDIGDLPLLTFGNCVLKAAVIKWPVKLYVRFVRFGGFALCCQTVVCLSCL